MPDLIRMLFDWFDGMQALEFLAIMAAFTCMVCFILGSISKLFPPKGDRK